MSYISLGISKEDFTSRLATSGVSLFSSFIFLFFNLSIGWLGLTVVYLAMLFYMALVTAITNQWPSKMDRRVYIVAVLVVLWNLSYVWSFSRVGSLTPEDMRYVVSGAANAIWVYLLAIIAYGDREFFLNFIRQTLLFYLVLSFFILCILVVQYHDPFVLRDQKFIHGWLNYTAFRNPNVMARNCFLMLSIAAFLHQLYGEPGCRGRLSTRFMLVGFSLIILLSLSRTNIFGLLLFWSLYFSKGRSPRFFVGVTILIFSLSASSLLLEPVWEKMENTVHILDQTVTAEKASKRISRRARQWIAASQIVLENPIYGVGASRAEEAMADKGSVKDGGDGVVSVHGGFLKILVYGGLFSLFFFLLLYGYLFQMAISRWRRHAGPFRREAGFQLGVMLTVLALMNVAGDNFGLAYTWIMLFILVIFTVTYPDDYVPKQCLCGTGRENCPA